MANFKLKIKKGTVAPGVGALDVGELGYNTTTDTLYVGNGAGQSATAFLNQSSLVTDFKTTLSGLTPSTASNGSITLAGTLGAASGGTGLSSYTAGDLLVASGATSFSKLGIGSTGQLLRVNGSSLEWWTPNYLTSHNVADNYAFKTISVSGQSDVVAESNTDTLTFAAGSNITITTSAASDTITIASAHPATAGVASSVDNSGVTYIQDITLDSFGHITGINSAAIREASASVSGLVSTGTQVFAGDKTFNDDIIIKGGLTVEGTLLTKDANEVNIGDAIIVLNAEESGTPSEDAGIEVERGTGTNAQLIWDESADEFVAGLVGALSPLVTEATFTSNETQLSKVDGSGDYISDITVSGHAITEVKSSWPTFNQSTTGNAATATALQNARTIAGVSFNGTANIAIPLANLSTVTLTSPATGHYLKYNGSVWVNEAFPTLTTDFLSLTDTPSAYTLQAGKVIRVNGDADALEFADANDHEHSAADITSGTLGVARGGTGTNSFTSGQVLIGAGTNAITTLSRSGIDSRTAFPAAAHTIGSHSDVTISSAAEYNVIMYDGSDWVNADVLDCGEYTT